MNPRITVAALLLISTIAHAVEFPHPDRIRYDSHCMIIDGKDTLIFSGAFHYFRCPKPLWRERFTKMKEAGLNCAETYVAWNWHEREMPANVDDFSKVDMTDLADWMKMAHEEFGLFTIIRPGPYICAEWAGGGFPVWLNLKKPEGYNGVWMRSDEPEFLNWCKHWLDACNKVVVPEQITRKPVGSKGVILYQIENEYDFLREFNVERRVRHLKSLYRDTLGGGIDVPIITCWTREVRGSTDPDLKNVFDGPNSYPRWSIENTGRDVDRAKQSQPNAPGMIPECQGGWFAQVGGQLSVQQDGVTAAQCNGITMMALAHGCTILNYYMFLGGTNFGDWAARTQPTTYDYASPIREPGSVDDKYQAVKAIGQMLQVIGPSLARSDLLQHKSEGVDSNVQIMVRRGKDGQTFIFCWNRQRNRGAEGSGKVTIGDEAPIELNYKLDAFGFKLLWLKDGSAKWLPEPVAPIVRPTPPAAVTIAQATRADSPEPTQWANVKSGDTLAAHGVFDSRYVMYRAKVSLNAEQVEKFKTLQLDQHAGDPVIVRVNGQIVTAGQSMRRGTLLTLGDGLRAGENEVTILYENHGYPNFGPSIEQQSGVRSGALVYTKTPDVAITQWKTQLAESQRPPSTQPGFDDSTWPSFTLDSKSVTELNQPVQPGAEDKLAAGRILMGRGNSRAVFRANLEITQEMLDNGQTRIVFDRIDDRGTVYINGQQAGESRSWENALVVDGANLLKPGANVIAVNIQNQEGDGGLTRPVRLVGTHVERIELDNLQLATQLPQPTSGWKPVSLGNESAGADGAMMSWYRLEFEVPETSKDAWIPWLARINATGNGMIWLNGQHLGRYWQIGPQRDFFLPSCWLKFGVGQKNEMIICLRPLDKPVAIQPVEVRPYENAAEKR